MKELSSDFAELKDLPVAANQFSFLKNIVVGLDFVVVLRFGQSEMFFLSIELIINLFPNLILPTKFCGLFSDDAVSEVLIPFESFVFVEVLLFVSLFVDG